MSAGGGEAPPTDLGERGDPEATPAGGRRRVARGAFGAWLVLAGACVALDGVVGGVVAVVVAAVVLARLPRHLLGALGAACLVGSMVSVMVDGLPTEAQVSPAFVSRSLIPHHLTFAGFVLVGSFVVLEVAAHVARSGRGSPPDEDVPAAPSRWLAMAVVAVVAAAAVAASVAVLAG